MKSIACVIPVFNGDRFIEQALDSVLSQTRVIDEIVVVDDGSKDGTADCVRAWMRAHPRVACRLVEQPNTGISGARNRGLRETECQYVALLDADDVWEPELVAVLENGLEEVEEAVLSVADGVEFSEDERAIEPFSQKRAVGAGRALRNDESIWLLERPYIPLVGGNFLIPSAILIDRNAALEIGGFDSSLRIAEDREFLLRLALQGDFVFMNQTLVRSRLHDGNLTGQGDSPEWHRVVTGIMDRLLENADTLGLTTPEREATRIELGRASERLVYAASRRGPGAYGRAAKWLARLKNGGSGNLWRVRDWARAVWYGAAGLKRGRYD